MSDMTPPPAPPAGGYTPGSENSKILAGIGYIIWVVALVALLIDPYKDESFVKVHAIQALGLWVIVVVVGWIPFVGWLISLVVLVFAIIGAINAFQGRYYEIPVLGGLLKGWFNV